MSKINFGRYSFNTSNEEKIFFPRSKITKGEMIDYYNKISEIMLPYIQDRPVSMLRLPDGIKGESFFQKDASGYFPNWIKTKKLKNRRGVLIMLSAIIKHHWYIWQPGLHKAACMVK